MELHFSKYQGTGNDFIVLDNRQNQFPKNDTNLVARLCDRRFGIGADGLLLLENDKSADFKMVYFNSDGKPGTMCGNGGRCLVVFAHSIGLIGKQTTFLASDGLHRATVEGERVSLSMSDVEDVAKKRNTFFLDTGSPHHVQRVKNLQGFEVAREGRRIRYGIYGEKGSNINFVEQDGPESFSVRTYERGVEEETLSCGTGVTAVAIAMHYAGYTKASKVQVRTRGGDLQVSFSYNGKGYDNVVLEGPATFVFKGVIR
ncbi:diaminopimelate epimerase [Muriicola jejuensis]|uniref:Diaminopimelate epimerase n=1 Tax=Muriicola jejuensis TaxID=504488 RepID=A0A6P0UEJ1_9FLAO|nr:diaminopimelate epimerase [Muriicola jejuensis]NER11042.1 diaminopimelate epimerase [Muriicola jejuensis]SMP23166.1 diaminopimelate epimerase [Muriicola jejuensis]